MRVCTEIRRKKMGPSRPAFQGQSRSLELAGIDRVPVTPISDPYSNHGPISCTVFKI